MNKEDYVSIEVAKLLKEKGYPQEYNVGTLCRMQNKANPYYEKMRAITQSDIDNAFCIFNEVYPTLYEAQKWLRNNHQIHISVGMCSDYSINADGEICDEWTFGRLAYTIQLVCIIYMIMRRNTTHTKKHLT